MAAGRVVATGRDICALEVLLHRFGPRVRVAPMTGDEVADRWSIIESADGPIDLVLDLLPREATGAQVRAAALATRPGGRIVLMGGVGRQGGKDLELPYPWLMRNDITVCGKHMYPREAVQQMVRLVRAGTMTLDRFDIVEFGLSDANAAVAHAASTAGPLRLTVLRPDSKTASNIEPAG